jgi:hypothetical protein
LFQINADGTCFEDLYSFGALQDGTHPQAAPLLIGGLIYGTTSEGGDVGVGTIYKFSASNAGGGPLSITLAGNNVVLSWPASATNLLQSTTSLDPATFWVNVTQTPTVINGQNYLTNPVSGAHQFYRLAP